MSDRTVIANIVTSIDGYTAGPDYQASLAGDGAFLIEHAIHPQMSAHFEGIYRGADTVLLGRKNYEGFNWFWPSVADDPQAKPRDRDYSSWMNDVEKVVFSRTLTETEWSNSRVAERSPEEEVRLIKAAPGRDIIVLSSSSIIRTLIEADLIDELRLLLVPTLLGGGLRLFPEGQPRSDWLLASANMLATGAIALAYTRKR